MVYEWLTQSDVTATMLGLPLYPDAAVPTWEEFCSDYEPHFFDGSAPLRGRSFLILVGSEPAGHVNYNDLFVKGGCKRVELDIWMRSRAWCGRGYGPDALQTLCHYLSEAYGIREFMVQPSARNDAAIRAYGKAGFRRIDLSQEAAEELWGSRDYHDSVYLVKQVGPSER